MLEVIQMPELLSNKIAAGEVVERPASVVKELVENSIDAGSTWIKVAVKEAGLDEVKVTDNGKGMSAEDCEAAFLRHATSKIKKETDLFHVKTLGFRGEALASIASVCRLKIQTSLGTEAGTELTLEGGKLVNKNKSDARQGTEITVSDLFFNTPARLKYMKSIHTELGHITDLLNRLAMAHPDIRLEVTHNGKSLFKTSGTGDYLQVIAQIYGINVARKMLPIQAETLDFSVKGFIAKPEITRASRSYITLIINGRYIKNYPLSQAVIRAYHTLLPIGRYPVVILNIKMDSILVDVNVHPTKLEVRFSKEKELVQLIEKTIREKFRQTTLIPEIEKKEPRPKTSVQSSLDFDQPSQASRDEQISNHIKKEQTDLKWADDSNNDSMETLSVHERLGETIEQNQQPVDSTLDTAVERYSESPSDYPTEQQTERVPTMYPIGQLHGTYIMAQNETGLYMIDQHAAQERIKYEFFKSKLGQPDNQLQELLMPITFEFSKQEALFIEHHKEKFQQMGLYYESFGDQTYVIRSHPTWFPKGNEEEIIREITDGIIKDESTDTESIREDAAILMSCKRSIKANHHLNHEDMFRLLEDLRKTTDPFTCPHGRPVIIHFTSYELEKMFKRVM